MHAVTAPEAFDDRVQVVDDVLVRQRISGEGKRHHVPHKSDDLGQRAHDKS